LLLVSDDAEVLDAFARIKNWELQGFKPPHIRHDFEGMLDSLSKHHADGIGICVGVEEARKIYPWLQEHYPATPFFQPGRTPEEAILYLTELKSLLNRLRADFSNDRFTEDELLQMCRHDFIRKLINGEISDEAAFNRSMGLLRSKMDPDSPCLLIELEQPALREDRLEGRWYDNQSRLETTLKISFASDQDGIHILPTAHDDGSITILACPLREAEGKITAEDLHRLMSVHVEEGIDHLRQYEGLELSVTEIREMASLTAFCNP